MLNRLIPLALIALCGGSALAQTPAPAATPGAVKAVAAAPAPAAAKPDPRDVIAKKIEGLKPDDVRISAVPGLYEIARGSQIGYVTGDARYVILGDLIDIDGDANLSENRRRTIRNVTSARGMCGRTENAIPRTTIRSFSTMTSRHCWRKAETPRPRTTGSSVRRLCAGLAG